MREVDYKVGDVLCPETNSSLVLLVGFGPNHCCTRIPQPSMMSCSFIRSNHGQHFDYFASIVPLAILLFYVTLLPLLCVLWHHRMLGFLVSKGGHAISDACAQRSQNVLYTHGLQALGYDILPWRKMPESDARSVVHTQTRQALASVDSEELENDPSPCRTRESNLGHWTTA